MLHSDEFPVPYVDTSAKIHPRDEPESLKRLMGEVEESSIKQPEADPALASPVQSVENAEASDDVIDASVPWNQRSALLDEENGVVD